MLKAYGQGDVLVLLSPWHCPESGAWIAPKGKLWGC